MTEQNLPESLSESEYYQVMANERRRMTLAILTEHSTPMDLSELSSVVASRESRPGEADVDEIKATLHHVHLPKLAGADMLAYDTENHQISP